MNLRKSNTLICVHGYSHRINDIPWNSTFMNRVGFLFNSCYAPPFWKIDDEKLKLAKNHYKIIFLKDRIVINNETAQTLTLHMPMSNNKFLWYLYLYRARLNLLIHRHKIVRIVFHEGYSPNIVDFFLRKLLE